MAGASVLSGVSARVRATGVRPRVVVHRRHRRRQGLGLVRAERRQRLRIQTVIASAPRGACADRHAHGARGGQRDREAKCGPKCHGP
jgi:hypothetical protein